MKIPVINRSKAKKVAVNVIKSKVDEVPTPPEDYAVREESRYLSTKENIDIYSKRNLAEQLSKLSPKELRQIVAAAKHLRKFADLLKEETNSVDWSEWDEEQLEVDE